MSRGCPCGLRGTAGRHRRPPASTPRRATAQHPLPKAKSPSLPSLSVWRGRALAPAMRTARAVEEARGLVQRAAALAAATAATAATDSSHRGRQQQRRYGQSAGAAPRETQQLPVAWCFEQAAAAAEATAAEAEGAAAAAAAAVTAAAAASAPRPRGHAPRKRAGSGGGSAVYHQGRHFFG
jgi:hypothetical protein